MPEEKIPKVSRKGAKNAKDAKNAGWPADVSSSDGLGLPVKTLIVTKT
jgi:hypothetical protein